jgi:hypothetical protein
MSVRRILACGCILLAFACAKPQPSARQIRNGGRLVFLTREGCVQTDTMRARLDESLKAMNPPLDFQVVDLATLKRDDPRTGYPTPTLLFADVDLFGMPTPTPPYPEPT